MRIDISDLPDALREKLKARVEMQPRVEEGNAMRRLGQDGRVSAGSEKALRRRARRLRERTSLYLMEEVRRTAVETGRA